MDKRPAWQKPGGNHREIVRRAEISPILLTTKR